MNTCSAKVNLRYFCIFFPVFMYHSSYLFFIVAYFIISNQVLSLKFLLSHIVFEHVLTFKLS